MPCICPPECYSKVLSFGAESEQVEMYLRGETVFDIKVGEKCKNGWNLVCVDKFSLGWGKLSNGVLKNTSTCVAGEKIKLYLV